MRQLGPRILIIGALFVVPLVTLEQLTVPPSGGQARFSFAQTTTRDSAARTPRSPRAVGVPLAPIVVDYPAAGSIFPPEVTAPTFLWRDEAKSASAWRIEVGLADGTAEIQVRSRGEHVRVGEIDPRCVSATNEAPKLTGLETSEHSWTPDPKTWEAIKKLSTERQATVTITGLQAEGLDQVVSRGRVTIQTSKDQVGAPIFYRDVPLMPSEVQKGVIKPLAPNALPLIAWRLRDVSEPSSRLLLEGLHTCANCHSFSRDGKTLGMDLDGPANDKGLYAIASVKPQMSILNEDVISWASFRVGAAQQPRVGFMSQVSPDGNYVVTTVRGSYYVANFKDYRFLQVFYPTRGVLAWYSRVTGQMHTLPGADDPRYVHTDAVWSPDGKYLVFARAGARDPYPEGRKLAERANDPDETPIQYDLYRIPFNGGEGGRPEPLAGASRNGVSNTFPKVSPDGRWIVFVQCRNGQLMRPDSQLYIVPAEGGRARRMQCNTPLMNSWHSFSPNGRWLVFSSKSRSPYTQMFLTHLDEEGRDSPAILIENATAANRAVNIPEFVDIPPGGLQNIAVPAAEFYRLFDHAAELAAKGQEEAAMAEWKKALELNPGDPMANNNFALHLLKKGELDMAIEFLQKAADANPGYADAQTNLGIALLQKGRPDDALVHFQKALEVNPGNVQTYYNLGAALYIRGRIPEALAYWQEGLRVDSKNIPLLSQMAWVLATSPKASVRNGTEAVGLAERAVRESGGQDPAILDTLGAAYAENGRFPEAVRTARQALALARQQSAQTLVDGIKLRLALYEANTPFRETP